MQSDYDIEIITPNGRPTLHAYFDLCTESPDGEHFVYFEFQDGAPGPGQVCVARTDNTEHRAIGPVIHGLANTAARQQWADNETVAIAFAGPDGCGTHLFSIRDGSMRTVPGVIRMAAPDGTFAMTSSHESARKYNQDAGAESVCRMDIGDGTLTELFTREDVMAIHPMRSNFAPEEVKYLWFKHTKVSPDSKRFFCVFNNEHLIRNKPEGSDIKTPRTKSLICANVDGSNMHYVGEFGHHPFWHWRGDEIWAAEPAGGAQRFVAYDAESGERRVAAEGISASHTALNPRADLFVMDVLGGGKGMGSLSLYDLASDRQDVLAEFSTPDTSQTTGCHPHPVWSRDGKSVYFNVSEKVGRPQLCRLRV